MGCINSKSIPLFGLKRDDMFNVSVVRVQAEQSTTLASNGFLELTRNEMIYVAPDKQPVSWAFQHLRRYGLSGNIFSFEAGRRCQTGPGIYTFKCSNAEQFYAKFERCIKSISLGDRGSSSVHSSYILGRMESLEIHSNPYLEPTSVQYSLPLEEAGVLPDSFSYVCNELSLNSPNSVQNTSFSTEIINFPPPFPSYSNVVANPHVCNIYLEQPININNNVSSNDISSAIHYKSAIESMIKSSSIDVPPHECAPILNTKAAEAHNLYENIGGCVPKLYNNLQNNCDKPVARSYANIEYIPKLEAHAGQPKCFQTELKGDHQHNTLTDGSIVNYIVLDLAHPRSPSQCSPQNEFSSGKSFSYNGEHTSNLEKYDIPIATVSCGSSTMPKGSTISYDSSRCPNSKMETSGSYTRIDFLKTFALMKSSTNCTDFDTENDQEESRITRHSKFIHKSFSISE